MALDTTVLAAIAAFAVVLVVLGAVFYSIVQSGKAAAAQEGSESKDRTAVPEEDEARNLDRHAAPKSALFSAHDVAMAGRPSGSCWEE